MVTRFFINLLLLTNFFYSPTTNVHEELNPLSVIMNNFIMPNDRILILVVTVIAFFSVCYQVTEASDGNSGKAETPVRNCMINADCQDFETCFHERECLPACYESSCGINAVCNASNHIRRCECPTEYTGNPYVECKKACSSDNDCKNDEECTDEHQCIPSCERNKCGENAYCISENHVHECFCPPNATGDPLVSCTKDCTANIHCDDDQICVKNTCINGCASLNCGISGRCVTVKHKPRCYCGRHQITTESCDNYCRRNWDCDLLQTCKNHECVDGWQWIL